MDTCISKYYIFFNKSRRIYFQYRGCRQGDPISAYIFIICAEILAIRIRGNELIKAIHIKQKEVKLTQFADDTTLILDGSEQALLDFGKLSGLKHS